MDNFLVIWYNIKTKTRKEGSYEKTIDSVCTGNGTGVQLHSDSLCDGIRAGCAGNDRISNQQPVCGSTMSERYADGCLRK